MATVEDLNTENEALRVDISYWNDRFNFEARLRRDLQQDKIDLLNRLEAAEANVEIWKKRALEDQRKLSVLEGNLKAAVGAIDAGVAALDAMKKVHSLEDQRREVIEKVAALEAELLLKDALAAEKK
jgi:hypothetical protein